MKAGRPSLTALYVALARAVATHTRELARFCDDAYAERLLPFPLNAPFSRSLSTMARTLALHTASASLRGMAEHMALRTYLIDEAVRQGVAAGAEQLVIVGAGLDARAHRLDALSHCDVYEVDFPSTQAFKQSRVFGLPVRARSLRYATCDFERTGLADALHARGFNRELRSVWIWEGVTMYLTPAMVAASLSTMASLSAPGSLLIASYLLPIPVEGKALSTVLLSILGALSEPIRSHFTEAALTHLLHEHGFSTLRDESPRDVAARHGVGFPAFPIGAPFERIVVAERRAPA